jgi:hexosaminidase
MSQAHLAIVPAPVSVRHGSGRPVRLSDGVRVVAPSALARVARWFRRELEAGTGWRVDVVDPRDDVAARAGNAVTLGLDADLGKGALLGVSGAYRLEIEKGRVRVTGDGEAGLFYGLQTLRQLLPDETLRRAPSSPGARGRAGVAAPVLLEPLVIEDRPRFPWRGVHLDVGRHFMPKSFLLKLVDLLAFHKCNVFHLHLTEDQGWRFPVDRYPRLVEVGAWRRQSPAGHKTERRFDGVPHGGYYTKDDLREVVAFAAERHVTVVPEVDTPGHVAAALAAYPELGNTGRRLEVGTRWGVYNQVLNLEDGTLQFCADVIDELCDLFPGPYVHIGGDECPTTEWARSQAARALMEKEGMVSLRELQGWFTAKVAARVVANGRRVVGWDEILEGGAPLDTVVMSWRGVKWGIEAALAGHDVVMAPQEWLYLDWAHADDPAEPLAIRAATSVEKVYGFDPVPAEVPEELRHHVLGAQCQLWTEYVETPERAEYQYFPRLCALAERVWSPAAGEGAGVAVSEARSEAYVDFEERLSRHLRRLQALGVNYRPLEGPTPGQARTWRRPRSARPGH